MSYRFIRALVRIIIFLIARVEVINSEAIPRQGSFIGTANHAGRLEVLLVFSILDRPDVILIIAEKYRQSAFWRWFAARVDGIFIDRYNADISALRQVLKRLQKGGVLTMAPEGTRSVTGKLQQGHMGAAFLAAKSGAPVLPVGVTGTWDQEVLHNLKRFRRTPIKLRVGQPYTLPPLQGPDREAQLQEYTTEIMCQIAALLPAELRGFYADHPRLQQILQPALG